MTGTQPYAVYHVSFDPSHNPVIPMHWHPEAEVICVQKGILRILLEDQTLHLSAGDILFIPPHILHVGYAEHPDGGVFDALVFSADLIAAPEDTEKHLNYVQPFLLGKADCSLRLSCEHEAHEALSPILRSFFSAAQQAEISPLLLEGTVRIVWHTVWSIHPIVQLLCKQPKEAAGLAQALLAFMHIHYAEDLSLTQMANTLHVNPSYLCRVFRQVTGTPPFLYLTRYRIMKSCSLLESTNKKISEIALLCGFNNVSYFNRCFQKLVHCTPSEYRKNARP